MLGGFLHQVGASGASSSPSVAAACTCPLQTLLGRLGAPRTPRSRRPIRRPRAVVRAERLKGARPTPMHGSIPTKYPEQAKPQKQ